jgi:hypothetical protein
LFRGVFLAGGTPFPRWQRHRRARRRRSRSSPITKFEAGECFGQRHVPFKARGPCTLLRRHGHLLRLLRPMPRHGVALRVRILPGPQRGHVHGHHERLSVWPVRRRGGAVLELCFSSSCEVLLELHGCRRVTATISCTLLHRFSFREVTLFLFSTGIKIEWDACLYRSQSTSELGIAIGMHVRSL